MLRRSELVITRCPDPAPFQSVAHSITDDLLHRNTRLDSLYPIHNVRSYFLESDARRAGRTD
jgi:hypothetical protein